MISQIGEVLAMYWRRAISSPIAMFAAAMLAFAMFGTLAAIPVETNQIALLQKQQLFAQFCLQQQDFPQKIH